MLSNDGSGQTALTERLRNEAMGLVTFLGQSQALRCLALAYKAVPAGSSQVDLWQTAVWPACRAGSWCSKVLELSHESGPVQL